MSDEEFDNYLKLRREDVENTVTEAMDWRILFRDEENLGQSFEEFPPCNT